MPGALQAAALQRTSARVCGGHTDAALAVSGRLALASWSTAHRVARAPGLGRLAPSSSALQPLSPLAGSHAAAVPAERRRPRPLVAFAGSHEVRRRRPSESPDGRPPMADAD